MLASHALPALPPPSSVHGAGSGAVPSPRERAREIARLLLRHQRRADGPARQPGECRESPCGACEETQARVIEPFVGEGRPVRLLLPAFPGKSPNRAKVLGTLPDLAEEVALEFLDLLAERIRAVHAPGAEIVICSDGRVFSDAVRIPDEDITAYHDVLRSMVAALPGRAVSVFTLDQAPGFAGLGHEEMRALLTERHAVPLESLRARIRQGEDLPLYRAITRFLFEDGNTPEYGGSRAALQREARRRAYVVIQRSKAWGDFLAEQFPGAVRLSIHPQPCSAVKLGVRLGDSTGAWLTPWHGVAVKAGRRVVLMKRAEAERLGCDLVERDGRPSHYVLREPAVIADEFAPGAVLRDEHAAVATAAVPATASPNARKEQ
jgi:L-tyrosine isonitrile synthase